MRRIIPKSTVIGGLIFLDDDDDDVVLLMSVQILCACKVYSWTWFKPVTSDPLQEWNLGKKASLEILVKTVVVF